MPNRSEPIDPRVRIGHVHLKVADLERALNFYCGILGFELMERHGDESRVCFGWRLSSSHWLEHVGQRGRQSAAAGNDRSLVILLFFIRRALN